MNAEEFRNEINEAVRAHSAWKARLKSAAVQKERNLPVHEITSDNHCRFGRWLADLPADASTAHVEEVRKLHRRFHQAAGQVASTIRGGDFSGALNHIEEGEFSHASAALVLALAAWRGNL